MKTHNFLYIKYQHRYKGMQKTDFALGWLLPNIDLDLEEVGPKVLFPKANLARLHVCLLITRSGCDTLLKAKGLGPSFTLSLKF